MIEPRWCINNSADIFGRPKRPGGEVQVAPIAQMHHSRHNGTAESEAKTQDILPQRLVAPCSLPASWSHYENTGVTPKTRHIALMYIPYNLGR